MARVRRDTDSEDTALNMDRMSHKDQMSNHVNQADKEAEEDEEDVLHKVDHVSNLLPSAQTIATVMRGIADVADLYGS